MSSRYTNLLGDLSDRLVTTRDDTQNFYAGRREAVTSGVVDSRARRRQTDQQVRELVTLIRQAAKRHRGFLVARKLSSPRGQTICELLYAVNGDGEVDRGVRFQIDHETDTLDVWWLPMIEPGIDDSPDVQIVVIGGFRPEVVFSATIAQIDFPATVTLIMRELISVNPGWHSGERPVLSPLPKVPEASTTSEQFPMGTYSGNGRFTRFRRTLWKRS